MTIAELNELFDYNRWANARMLAAAGALDADGFTRDTGSSFPSVRATLAHILAAEWVWLQRWRGTSPTTMPSGWADADHATIVDAWQTHEREQAAFLATLDDARLAAPLAYRNTRGDAFAVRLDALLRHVVNHSSYHRGQVATMLRQLGAAAPATDFVLYHTSGAAGRAR
jgi:uncharacterized damage-inducible protein DinB